MLRVTNISVIIGKKTRLERKILSNLNLSIEKEGEFVSVIGGNGSGKSTMLKVISGSLNPDSGFIYLDDLDITKKTQKERSSFIAKVMQDPSIGTIENLSILENMSFAFKRGERRFLVPFCSNKRIIFFKDQLSRLGMGMEDRLHEKVFNLSGGQRQALSLVMATMKPSRILLLDEITAALDPKTSKHVMQLAYKIVKEEKMTCIMVTHDLNDALKFSDRILLLKNGHFIKEFSDTKNTSYQDLLNEFL